MPGVNSGQTSITYCDLAYYVETTAGRKLKGFDHETGSQISFPNFTFRHEFFYVSVVWRSENQKNISWWYLDAKESTNQGQHFLNFNRVVRVQSQLGHCMESSAMATPSPEIVYTRSRHLQVSRWKTVPKTLQKPPGKYQRRSTILYMTFLEHLNGRPLW